MPKIFLNAEIDSLIQKSLDDFFKQYVTKAEAVDRDYAELWAVIEKVTSAGGKRIRPKLYLLSAAAYKQRFDLKSELSVATSWEILHSSLLILDDIMDRDMVRHGQDNVQGIYEKQYVKVGVNATQAHWAAHNAALLGGILLLTAVTERLSTLSTANPELTRAIDLLYEAIYITAAGQLLYDQAPLQAISVSDPSKIYRYKTAFYSVSGPLITPPESTQDRELLQELGECLGIGFQLADDLLGSFGNSDKTGKSHENDIMNGKRTQLLKSTYELASVKDRRYLDSLNFPLLSLDDVHKIREMMIKTGSKDAIEKQIHDLHQKCIKIIEQLNIKDEYREEFKTVAQMLLIRNV